MTRVFFLYRLKRALYSWWTKASLLAVFALGEYLSISFVDIWDNLQDVDTVSQRARYLATAAFNTEISVQLLFAGMVCCGFLLMRTRFHPRKLFTFWRFA